MTKRKEAMLNCIAEAQRAKKYMENALRHVENGEASKGWNSADFADTAARCAMQEHDKLWALAHGKLTNEEFEAFCAAEEAVGFARKAALACAALVQKIQAEYDAECARKRK